MCKFTTLYKELRNQCFANVTIYIMALKTFFLYFITFNIQYTIKNHVCFF